MHRYLYVHTPIFSNKAITLNPTQTGTPPGNKVFKMIKDISH